MMAFSQHKLFLIEVPEGFADLLEQDFLFHNLPFYWPSFFKDLQLCCIFNGVILCAQ